MTESHTPPLLTNVTPLSEDQEFQRLRSQLEDRLLALGGQKVVWDGSKGDLENLLNRGQRFDQKVRLCSGDADTVELNTVFCWAADVEKRQLVKGYALDDDGLWRKHCWVVLEKHLYESTTPKQRYLGVALNQADALLFFIEHYVAIHRPSEEALAQLLARYPGLDWLYHDCMATLAGSPYRRHCPDCHVALGQRHKRGCDVEPCPCCGQQLLSCEHYLFGTIDPPPLDDRMVWTGLWPGKEECREFGWYTKLVPGKGWVPCAQDEPGAQENLSRLDEEARWDRAEKRWVKKETTPNVPRRKKRQGTSEV